MTPEQKLINKYCLFRELRLNKICDKKKKRKKNYTCSSIMILQIIWSNTNVIKVKPVQHDVDDMYSF